MLLRKVRSQIRNQLLQLISDVFAYEKVYIGGIALYDSEDVVPVDGYTVYYVNGNDGEAGYIARREPVEWNAKLTYVAKENRYVLILKGLQIKRTSTHHDDLYEKMGISFESNRASLELIILEENYIFVANEKEVVHGVSIECHGEGTRVDVLGDGKLFTYASSDGIGIAVNADVFMHSGTIVTCGDRALCMNEDDGSSFVMRGGRLIARGRTYAITGRFKVNRNELYQWRTIEDGVMVSSDELEFFVGNEEYAHIEFLENN